jgi:hypothetical protein
MTEPIPRPADKITENIDAAAQELVEAPASDSAGRRAPRDKSPAELEPFPVVLAQDLNGTPGDDNGASP